MDDHGQWILDQKLLKDMAIQFYSNLFSSSGYEHQRFQRGHFPTLPEDKVLLLNSSCSADEVSKSIRDMHPHKASGPDGFNDTFF